MPGSKQILFATIGSLGDLHPCLALAIELKRRGHRVCLATTEFYRGKVEALGLQFLPLRPNWRPDDPLLIGQCEEIKRGPEVLFRTLVLPHLRNMFSDLFCAAQGVDLMLAGELVYAAPLVAEKRGLRWASIILSPASFLSAHDPSLLVNLPSAYRLRDAGWLINRAILEIGRFATQHWWQPVRELRRELGLRTEADPLFRDKFSDDLVLALFSRHFAGPQPDWPRNTVQSGFVFFDHEVSGDSVRSISAFLREGSAPLVFTLGSTAVHCPHDFYRISADAARQLGKRVVLLGTLEAQSSAEILAVPYAPYAAVFPYAAAIVHQGGSGTTAQALRAGRPMMCVPFGWDQPDNAARLEKLGASLTVSRAEYSVATAVQALKQIVSRPPCGEHDFAARVTELASCMEAEDAVATACNAIEAIA